MAIMAMSYTSPLSTLYFDCRGLNNCAQYARRIRSFFVAFGNKAVAFGNKSVPFGNKANKKRAQFVLALALICSKGRKFRLRVCFQSSYKMLKAKKEK
jgi:hypothetical protein